MEPTQTQENSNGLVPKIFNDIKNIESRNTAAKRVFWVSLGIITFTAVYAWFSSTYMTGGYNFQLFYFILSFASPFVGIAFAISMAVYFSTSVRLHSLRKKIASGNIGTELVSPSNPKSVGNHVGEMIGSAILFVVVVFLIGFGLCVMMFSSSSL